MGIEGLSGQNIIKAGLGIVQKTAAETVAKEISAAERDVAAIMQKSTLPAWMNAIMVESVANVEALVPNLKAKFEEVSAQVTQETGLPKEAVETAMRLMAWNESQGSSNN